MSPKNTINILMRMSQHICDMSGEEAGSRHPCAQIQQLFLGTFLMFTEIHWVLKPPSWTNDCRHGGDALNVVVIEPVIVSTTMRRAS